MPSKNMAVLLSNESNLRIIEMLKSRPYYPRELAAEMSLSEPFVVRRLRSLEEYGIVEGKWESNGSRRVKRYFLKDVTLELARTGLKIKMDNAPPVDTPVQYTINLRDEANKWALMLPLVAIIVYGIIFKVTALLLIFSLYFLWWGAINFAYHRKFGLRSTLLMIFMDLFLAFIISANLIEERVAGMGLGVFIGILATIIGIIILILMTYRIRYSQHESDMINTSTIALMDIVATGPSYLKVFYLPMAIKCKIYEFFGVPYFL